MERLTRKIEDRYDYAVDKNGYCFLQEGQLVKKLGQLEDIMEKYDIESIEELEDMCEDKKKLYRIIDNSNERIKVLEKALELACDYIIDEWAGTELDDIAEKMGGFKNYFIEQAKKELGEKK